MANGATAGTPLDRDIVELLKTCPSVWTEVDFDRQSSIRETSLAHLVSAGLIEARHTWRWTFQPPSAAENATTETEEVEFVVDVRGENWTQRLNQLWPTICPPHWFNGTTGNGFTEGSITAVKIRLSDQGESARHDLEGGDENQVVDFVLRRRKFAKRLPTIVFVNVVSSVRKPNSVGWPKREVEHTGDGVAEALAAMPSEASGQSGKSKGVTSSTQATTTNVKPLKPSDAKPNKLCELDDYVLLALGELKAFDKDSRRKAELVANHLDPKNDRYYIKKPLAKLKRLKLAGSKQGTNGGSWLTAKGKRRFDALNAKR